MRPGPKPKDRTVDSGRHCIRCDEIKAPADFYSDKRRPDGLDAYCKACRGSRAKNLYKRQSAKQKAAQQRYRRKRREEAIAHYGGKCACCGESRYEFLAIDHENGGGLAHRREVGGMHKPGIDMAQWCRRNKYPNGFRVLCHNCNMALGFYGYCPHDR